jgi:hypothetical protein
VGVKTVKAASIAVNIVDRGKPLGQRAAADLRCGGQPGPFQS